MPLEKLIVFAMFGALARLAMLVTQIIERTISITAVLNCAVILHMYGLIVQLAMVCKVNA